MSERFNSLAEFSRSKYVESMTDEYKDSSEENSQERDDLQDYLNTLQTSDHQFDTLQSIWDEFVASGKISPEQAVEQMSYALIDALAKRLDSIPSSLVQMLPLVEESLHELIKDNSQVKIELEAVGADTLYRHYSNSGQYLEIVKKYDFFSTIKGEIGDQARKFLSLLAHHQTASDEQSPQLINEAEAALYDKRKPIYPHSYWSDFDIDAGAANNNYYTKREEEAGINILEANRLARKELDSRNEQIVPFLTQYFGIKNYFRYPPDVLNQQFELMTGNASLQENKDYALFIFANADHNGAFDRPWQLKNRPSMPNIIIEADSYLSFMHEFDFVTTELGPASTLVINAHGEPTSFNLDKGTDVNIQNLIRNGTPLGEGVKKHGNVIFNSCSTGTEEIIDGQAAIAVQMSKLLPDVTICAPNKPASVANYGIRVSRISPGSEEFIATIVPNWGEATRTYKDGFLINNDFNLFHTEQIRDYSPYLNAELTKN